jgi:hypothetical protein
MSKIKHRIGPCPAKDKRWVSEWCSKSGDLGKYRYATLLHKQGWTWHQIRGLITGKGL